MTSTGVARPRVAFIGLGRMGQPMARRVLAAGFPTAVWNRSAGRADELWLQGARRAESPADAVHDADVVVTMLADPAALHAVLDGSHGVFVAIRPGALLIDCSTIGPATARETAVRCRAHSAGYVDAPVLGSVPAAEQGTLTILAGGEPDDVARATDLLLHLGRSIVRTGDAGSPRSLKLVMNLLVGGQTELMAEAFLLAERAGLTKQIVSEALTSSVLNSPFVGYKAPQLLERSFTPLFTTALLLKDIDLALELARTHALALPGVRAVRDAYAAASAAGRHDDDFSAVIDTLDVTGDRGTSGGRVTYEVRAQVEPAYIAAFEAFLRDTHLRDVVRTGCFLHGRLEHLSEGSYRIAYLAPSHEAVDHYLETHGFRLRDQMAAAFPVGVTVSRTIWTERARWP